MTTLSSQTYSGGQRQDGSGGSTDRTTASIVLLGFGVLIVLFKAIHRLCTSQEQEPERRGGLPAPNGGADPGVGGGAQAGPPVVCMYRRADGWREATCPVCLSDFTDGEAVSVLPACMHYFHVACIGEWLRARATCPLCRAAP